MVAFSLRYNKKTEVNLGLLLFVTVKKIDADSLRHLRCMVKRHRKNTLFLISQHCSIFLISQHCSINYFETAKHLQLTVDRLGKTSSIETSLLSSCVYPAYNVCIARGTQNAQDTPKRQPKTVAND